MFNKKMPFLVSVSSNLKFKTPKHIINIQKITLVDSIRKILNHDSKHGFTVDNLQMNIEIEVLIDELKIIKGPNLNTVVTKENSTKI